MNSHARDRYAPAETAAPAYADRQAHAAPQWPPPLLEPLLGAAWRVAWAAAAGGILLFAPLLYRLTRRAAAAWSPGAAPQSLPELLAAAGLILLVLATSRALRSLALARAALAAGHGRLTVLEVAADRRGDTGSAIAGEREYRELPPEVRTLLRVNRVAAAALAILTGVLPAAGFLAVVLLAYGGAAQPDTAAIMVFGLLPATGGLSVGALALESLLLAGPRRRWAADAVAALAPDVAEWAEQFDAVCEGAPGRGRPGSTLALRLLGVAAVLGVLATAAFALLFGAASFRARALVEAATPVLDGAARRIAGVEAARPYRLPPDATISAEAAGEALHALIMAGHANPDPLFRPPVRTYDRGWTRPDGPAPFPTPVPAPDWVRAAADGLAPEQAAYLRESGAHPAVAELATLARAAAIEIGGTRYVMPLPPTATQWTLPLPRSSAVRDATDALFARALLALDAGRAAEAEEMLREILSAGVLLAGDAPFPIDAFQGVAAAALGLTSLGALYDATGRGAEAAHVAHISEAVRRATAIAGSNGRKGAAGRTQRSAAAPGVLALDPGVPRAVRWELAVSHVVVSECGSLRHRLFGESAAYREWKEQARAALVRSPGDAALFELVLETPARAELPPRGAFHRAAAFAARLIPGGRRCTAIWLAM